MTQKIKLRRYQEETVENATSMLFERNNSLIVAGTGAGKTIMMAACIGRFFKGFYSKGGRKPHVLVLVHRTEIHDQNHEKFTKVCPDIAISELTAERKSLHGYVHFGMVQTVSGLLNEFDKGNVFFDLIVIDEAHHSAANIYKSIINWNKAKNPDTYLLGVTATPNRGDKLPLVGLFDNYKQVTSSFLINSHFLVRPKFIDLSPIFKTDKGEEKGRLSKNVQMDLLGKKLIAELVSKYLENKELGKSIIFAPTHEFCVAICEELRQRKRKPAYLSLGLDAVTREKELERFEKGDAEELINVDIATEGYDFPELRNIAEFDTNGTHSQWIQKVGRVLRTAEGKTSCTVIDFGGNIDLYPNGVETDVNLDGVVKKPKGEHLTEEDFFKLSGGTDKITFESEFVEARQVTPYAPPVGFETINDEQAGIVFVACGKLRDCLIVGLNGEYFCFCSDKKTCDFYAAGEFERCVSVGMAWLKGTEPDLAEAQQTEKPISIMQTRLLSPEYPTQTLTWYGANCCICWKTWKSVVITLLNNKENNP